MIRRLVIVLVGLAAALPSAHTGAAASVQERIGAVAVFPVDNVSGDAAPGEVIRSALIHRLASRGFPVVNDAALDDFITRHRVRYLAGIDASTADALRRETGAGAVLLASIELSSAAVPPKMALTVRLVSTTGMPAVVWAEDAGLAGDDAPGFFELGLVNDYGRLQERALRDVTDSLLAFLETGARQSTVKRASKFRPKSSYRAVVLEPGRTYSVAVVPFFNLSARRHAGEIMALHFVRHLASFPQFRVVDLGVTRRQLLDARIIMDGGLSLRDADTVAALIEADFVLGGRVLRYEDYEGASGRTRVEFSTTLIDRRTRRVVWSSDSYNNGQDGVGLFERGLSRTAHAMARQMVRFTAEMIAGPGSLR